MSARGRRIFQHVDDGVDALVFYNAVEPHLDMSFFYVTGLPMGLFEGSMVIVEPPGRARLLTTPLEAETARRSRLPVHVAKSREAMKTFAKRFLRGKRKVGINAEEITHRNFLQLKEVLPKAEFVDVSKAVRAARLVKDSDELSRIRRAADIASRAFEDVLPFLRPGRREIEVAAELNYRMQKRGAAGPSFTAIVGSGPNGAEPHYTAGERRLQKGEFVVMDFGASYRRYASDLTRTVAIGKASSKQREIYSTVKRAQDAGFRRLRPGAKGKDVDAAARRVIDRTRYKGRFIHSLGHSLGLAVHDGAGLSPMSEVVVRQGMVFTVEPGIYVTGYGGVRIEDDVVVRRGGPEFLTTATRDLLEL